MSKYVWKFDVQNRPTKEKDGVTKVSQDFTLKGEVAGEVIEVGSITKSRGAAEYVATAVNGADVGTFDTRSKAAHALRRLRVANAAKVAAPTETETTEPTEAETETTDEGEPEIAETTETETTEADLGGEAA